MLNNILQVFSKKCFVNELGGGLAGANAHVKEIKININSPKTNGREIKNKQDINTSLVSVGWK